MKKNLLFYLITLCCTTSIYCQENSVAAGGEATGSGGSASYSIGQTDYKNAENGASINEGVQQPYEFYKVGIVEIDYVSTIYPNPSTDEIKLSITNTDGLSCKIYDASGKLVKELDKLTKETIVQVAEWSKGTYLLSILKSDQKVQTIKIIKH